MVYFQSIELIEIPCYALVLWQSATPLPCGPRVDRCVGWVESEVHDWILARIEERDLAEDTVNRPSRLSVAS